MAGIDNTIIFSSGERLTASSATDIVRMQESADSVSRVNHVGNPEGVISANPSSLSHDPVSGDLYLKQTGTGNTGWVQIGSGGGSVTVTADDGNSINSSPYDIFGTQAGVVPVNSSTITGGQLFMANNTWDTQYVVDPSTTTGLKGTFQTIQAAINQAVADGATLGSYRVVKLRSKVYTENLTIPGGIIIVGQTLSMPGGGVTTPYQSSVIVGNHTFTGNAVGAFQDVNFLTSSGDTFSGGAIVLWYSNNCFFANQGTDNNFNITAANSYLSFINCQMGGAGQKMTFVTANLFMSNCTWAQSSTISSTSGSVSLFGCYNISDIVCSGASLNLNNCSFNSNTAAFNISGTAGGLINSCSFLGASGAGVESTITASMMNCSTNGSVNNLYETGYLNSGVVSQQGSLSFGRTVNISSVSPYSLVKADHYVAVNNTSGTGQIILLNGVGTGKLNEGQEFIIKDVTGNAATNNIQVTVDGVVTIDGQLSYVINVNYGSITVRFDGTNYFII